MGIITVVKRVIEINMAGRGKTCHFLVDPHTPVTNAWTLNDNILLHHLLTTMEPKIQDLILHCMTVKELWCFLRDLYGGSININRAYGVIQELFQKNRMVSAWMIITASSIF